MVGVAPQSMTERLEREMLEANSANGLGSVCIWKKRLNASLTKKDGDKSFPKCGSQFSGTMNWFSSFGLCGRFQHGPA